MSSFQGGDSSDSDVPEVHVDYTQDIRLALGVLLDSDTHDHERLVAAMHWTLTDEEGYAVETPAAANSEAAIWARIIDPQKNGLSREAAQSLLQLTFSDWDWARMNELAERN